MKNNIYLNKHDRFDDVCLTSTGQKQSLTVLHSETQVQVVHYLKKIISAFCVIY